MAGSRKGVPNKRTLLALHEIDRLGLKPIEMIAEVYRRAMSAYEACRGLTDKGDAGAAYLSVAGQMATKLASFQYPTLGAIAVQNIPSESTAKPLTTIEAVDIINSDPFLTKRLHSTKETMDVGNSLPIGQVNSSLEPS